MPWCFAVSQAVLLSREPAATLAPAAPRRHWGRWLLLGLGLLGLLAGLGVPFLLDPWLRRTLEEQVSKRSKGRYQLRVTQLHTSLWRRSATLHGLRLRTATTSSPDSLSQPRLQLALGRLSVSGVGLLALLQRHEVLVDSITLDSLTVHLAALPQSRSPQPLHRQLPFAGLRLGQLALRHVRATYGAGAQAPVQLGESALVLQDVWLSAAGAADPGRVGYARAVAAQVAGAAVRVPGHEVKLVRAAFSSVSRQLRLDSVLVHPQQPISSTRSPALRVSLALPRLVLSGLDAAQLSRRRFRADTLEVTRPRLALTLPARQPPALHQLLQPYMKECRLTSLRVTGGQLRVAGLALAPALAEVELAASGIQVLPRQKVPTDIYYARAWQVRTGAATASLDAPFYHLSWQSLQADSRTGRVQIRQVLALPTMSVEALARGKKHQSAHVSVRVPEVLLTGLNFPAAANQQQLRATALLIRSPRISTRSDGRFATNPNISVVTPEMLGRLPFRFAIARFAIQNAALAMSFRSPRDPQPGIMSIDRLSVRLRNLTNDPRRMRAATPLTGEATGWLQNQCAARITLRANLLDASGRHMLTGEFGAAPLSILNSMLVPTRGIAIRSGTVRRIRFQMQLDRTAARGTMWGEYAGLKLQLLNQQERPGVLHRVGTSLVNGIFIRDNNPRKPGQPLQTGTIASSRERRYSVFSLWRQGMVSGLLNSAGVPAGMAKKLSEAE
ncbi:hypothetical protein [Hymenobacter glacieicola]|uniref:AsmA-like C-terminal domain-containing protein n=1 Tax=Hymenobacter glacieicola TaxID=1562124 RepID=A0ABQ1WWU1_9BACT|nr:hypothetical protein [Hymenobacter glacieicola]GGG47968.1 hypothetical protein GCM10011378_25180 [Hymenobacter glacieicola]